MLHQYWAIKFYHTLYRKHTGEILCGKTTTRNKLGYTREKRAFIYLFHMTSSNSINEKQQHFPLILYAWNWTYYTKSGLVTIIHIFNLILFYIQRNIHLHEIPPIAHYTPIYPHTTIHTTLFMRQSIIWTRFFSQHKNTPWIKQNLYKHVRLRHHTYHWMA